MRHVCIVLAGLAALCFLEWGHIPKGPYLYDEADYMFAASQGYWANASDTPTQPIVEFFGTGLSRGRDPGQRAALSELIRANNDVLFYRHWHGPVYSYWLMATGRWKDSESTMRLLTVVFTAAAFLAIYCGCLWLWPGEKGRTVAVLASSLYLFSVSNLSASTDLAPHGVFVLCAVTSLFFTAKMFSNDELKYACAAMFAAGVAFCCLELAFVILLTFVIVFVWNRWREKSLTSVLISALALACGVAVAWPGAVFKLSFVKAYAFMVYLAFFRHSPWGNTGLSQAWRDRVLSSPAEWLLIAGALALYFSLLRTHKVERRAIFPFVMYSLLMMIVLIHVTADVPRYLLPYVPVLDIFAGLTLAVALQKAGARLRIASVAGICVLLFGTAAWKLNARPAAMASRGAAILVLLRDKGVSGESLLVPQTDLPMIHYYFPKTKLRGYADPAEMRADLATGSYAGVLYADLPVRFDKTGER